MMNLLSMRDWRGWMIGRYRLIRLLGRGGMGEVWLAEDGQLRRQVAMKLLPIDVANGRAFLEDFEREARAAAALEHPNILQVHDFGEQQVDTNTLVAYLVMPNIVGGSLRDRILAVSGPLPPAEALSYLRQAASAIDYAHSKQVLHRDIKPANMLLQQNWLFLADFGIAKLLSSPTFAGRTHSGAGTPEYMAPEQVQGHAVAASDIYSLAMTAYLLLTGHLPFQGDMLSVLRKQVEEEPPRPRLFNPAMPLVVEQALLWGLAKRPIDRPASCVQLVDALEGKWQGPHAITDAEGTILAPWSKRYSGQARLTFSGPINMTNTVAQEGAAPFIAQTQKAPTSPVVSSTASKAGKRISRRSLLIGSTGAAVVAIGAGGALFYYLHSHSGIMTTHNSTTGKGAVPRSTPTPIPGPQKFIPGIPLLSLVAHKGAVAQVAWDKTGRYLASGGRDSSVLLWDIGALLPAVSGQQTLITPAHSWKLPDQVLPNAFSWSSDGRMIAAVVLDQNVYVINTNSDAAPQIYTDSSQSNNILTPKYDLVAWSPSSNIFAVHDFNSPGIKCSLWQAGHLNGPQSTLSYFDPTVSNNAGFLDALSWSVDGSKLAGHTDYSKEVIWNVAGGNVLQTFTMINRPQFGSNPLISNECQAWSPATPGVLATSDLDLVYIWDVTHNKQLLTLQINEPLLKNDIQPPYIWAMSWSPNGRYLAVSLPRSPRIYIWDIQTALQKYTAKTFINQTLQFPEHNISNGSAINLAWSPNGRYIAVGYDDTTVIVWKVDGA
ncbi:MAG TPA: serine/threonine-protein kinase [Ktedonobacteraceae bacterium]|jgi:serine/threonine protein kinase|nr:serine/threonine-protein kinase [Ktedonobacteraceae bacterium]